MRRGQTAADLVSACRAGDAEAWDALIERYERLVYAVAIREGLCREDAADVTQVTFEELLNQLDRIRDDAQIASWLMTVARRQAWRVRDRQRRHLDHEPPGDGTVGETVHDPVADHDLVLWLYDGLAKLGRECRWLLTSLYFDPASPSYAEVAGRLGRPVGAIGPTRARCLQRLRAIMTEVSDDASD